MHRDTDGWHLELVAFGGSGTRADERIAALPGMKELRQIPLKGAGWERRDFRMSLEAKGEREIPVHVTILAYGPAEHEDFVPDLSHTDGLLFIECGDAARDERLGSLATGALAKRLGNPPRIVERAQPASVKEPLRDLVKRVVKARKAGELDAFWKENVRQAELTQGEAIFGPLTREKILGQPRGEVVDFLLRVIHGRGRRAVARGRLPNRESFERSLSNRWQRLMAVELLDGLVRDAGLGALFAAPGERALQREEVVLALAGLKRIGVPKKAELVERALGIAREANLWEGTADATASAVLEELSTRYYAIDDEPLRDRLEDDVRKSPDDFTLGAYED
ncbi:MAG: hypothetical protein JST00_33995 [Deltaproteobacteria bacterium]|nr:hypothetical protein [Deltaproteobacteria bacterium]